MPQKLLLPFITDDQGRSLTEENGTIVTRAIPTEQELSPDGWEKSTVQFARHAEYRGIFTSYTTPLKFFLESAKILRFYYYSTGMKSAIFFIWTKLNLNFFAGLKYDGWYKGQFDFSTFKDVWDGVQINITEGGFYKDLNANKDIVQEIPVQDDDAVSLYMDGIVVEQKLMYEDTSGIEVSIVNYGLNFLGPVTLVAKDGNSVGIFSDSENLETAPAVFADRVLTTNVFLKNVGKTTIPVTIAGVIEFVCTGMTSSPAFAIRFRYLTNKSTIGTQNDYQIFSTGLVPGVTYTHPFSITISLEPGETILREGIFFGGSGSDAKIEFTDNSKATVSFKTRKDPTVVAAQTVYNLGNKLTKKISNNLSTLVSPFLLSDVNLLVTPGDAIRGIPTAVFKTKFSDYHKSVDAVKCIEMEIVDNNPVIKSRYDAFTNNTISNLGECSKWECEPALDYLYDSVEVGYPVKDPLGTDNVNGRYSFNNKFIWKTPINEHKNTYKAMSVYLSDPYVIESFRINFENKQTTDSTSDNEVFFLDAEKFYSNYTGNLVASFAMNLMTIDQLGLNLLPGIRFKVLNGLNIGTYTVIAAQENVSQTLIVIDKVPVDESGTNITVEFLHYKLRRVVYSAITGVPVGADLFNIELSPARILRNHYRWIKSSLEHNDSDVLEFKSTEKNADLETIDASGGKITEKANISIAAMGERVFLPHYFFFEVESPFNLYDLMKTDSNGKFLYTNEGIDLDGFPIDIKTEEVTSDTQRYQLLASASNNMSKLIDR